MQRQRRNKTWSMAEKNFLKANWQNTPTTTLAREMHRTVIAVSNQALAQLNLGVKNGRGKMTTKMSGSMEGPVGTVMQRKVSVSSILHHTKGNYCIVPAVDLNQAKQFSTLDDLNTYINNNDTSGTIVVKRLHKKLAVVES